MLNRNLSRICVHSKICALFGSVSKSPRKRTTDLIVMLVKRLLYNKYFHFQICAITSSTSATSKSSCIMSCKISKIRFSYVPLYLTELRSS